jgi:hypothetical protein
MQKHIVMTLVSGILLSGALYADPQNEFDPKNNQELTPEQIMRLTFDLAAYKNIIKAEKEARESSAYKKSLAKFEASLKNLMQTYTKEVAARLTQQERDLINDILADARQMTQTFKEDMVKIDSENSDQAVKDQLLQDLQNKVIEQGKLLAFKIMPFGVVVQEEETSNPQDAGKNLQDVLSSIISFIDSLMATMKKGE